MGVRDRLAALARRAEVPVDEVPDNTPTVAELRNRRERSATVRLTDHEQAVAEQVLPYIGETPVLPDKVNPTIPDNVWQCMQESGALAAVHLNLILKDKSFPKLPVREQARIIELAMSRAYGSVDGAVRKNLHVFVNPEDAKGFNALAEMARRAQKSLPEFNRKLPDVKSDD